jgi:asparagine synthase (glutamine-hydrolysing)
VAGAADPFRGTPEEAVDELEARVSDAIRQQMIADVPLGAFLSGGVDSSTVVALMQSQSTRPVKTFSIGFHEDAYNEADHAKLVAEHLGTEHTELYVSPEEALAVIPELPEIYSEPFADSSQVPTVLVSRLARRDVTVSLSGDGGDELLCGYTRYERSAKLWDRLRRIPGFVRSALARGITLVPPSAWDQFAKILPGADLEHFGDRLHKSSHAIASRSLDELYLNFLMSHNRNPDVLVRGGVEPPTVVTGNAPELPGLDNVQRMMALDQLSYLPDDILAKVDRAAMAVSLETRVPFLDHRIVEFASSLPQSIKVRDAQAKWPLRQVLCRHVDRELIDRPKMGFGVPIEHWLRGPLRDWGEELLGEQRLSNEGFFEPAAVRRMWTEHVEGKRRWHHHLWDLLMFQAWLECQQTS